VVWHAEPIIHAGRDIWAGQGQSLPARMGGELMPQFAKLAAITAAGDRKVYENNPIRVFVTHGFAEDEDYLRFFEFLEGVDRFFYINCSKPQNVPASGGMEAIKEELIRQIKEAEAVVVLASQYSEKRDLIRFQMDVADANDIPMIVVRPFGGMAETPKELLARVKEHIEWNSREMADALRRQARLEDTARWDVIDFP
jgi:hypothetical protein